MSRRRRDRPARLEEDANHKVRLRKWFQDLTIDQVMKNRFYYSIYINELIEECFKNILI